MLLFPWHSSPTFYFELFPSFYWFYKFCFFLSFSFSMLAMVRALWLVRCTFATISWLSRHPDQPPCSTSKTKKNQQTHTHKCSGFLVTLLFLRTKKPSEAKRNVDFVAGTKQTFMLIIYRYIRLTPVYFMVIIINAVTLKWVPLFVDATFSFSLILSVCFLLKLVIVWLPICQGFSMWFHALHGNMHVACAMTTTKRISSHELWSVHCFLPSLWHLFS